MDKVLEGRSTETLDAASEFGYKRADGLSMSTGNPEKGTYESFHKNTVEGTNFSADSYYGISKEYGFGVSDKVSNVASGALGKAKEAAKGAGKMAADKAKQKTKDAVKDGIKKAAHSVDEMAAPNDGSAAVEAMQGVNKGIGKTKDTVKGTYGLAKQVKGRIDKRAAKRLKKSGKLSMRAERAETKSLMFAEKAQLAASRNTMKPGGGRKGKSFAERWYIGRSRVSTFFAHRDQKKSDALGGTKKGILGRLFGKSKGSVGKIATGGFAKLAALGGPAILICLIAMVIIIGLSAISEFFINEIAAQSNTGACIIIPEEYRGSVFTVTEYGPGGFGNGAVDKDSDCYPVWKEWMDKGAVYTNGIATIDGSYLIACTKIFGSCGDRMIWEFEDGTQLMCIMADTKDESWAHGTPAGIYGHRAGNSWNNLEFEVDTDWYHRFGNPGQANWLPEIAGKRPCKVYNLTRAPQGSDVAQKIIEAARQLLGTPYKLGADVGSGYVDCSGLTSYCYEQVGIPIPRTSEDQHAQAPSVLPRDQAQPGDILWMQGHVGIYIGGGRTIEALPQGVIESTWDKFTACLHWPQVTSGPASDVMTEKGQKIVNACHQIGSPGGGLCAMWVSMVYQRALGYYPGGDARDMYARLASTDLTTLQPGMAVAVSTHPGTAAGRIYGHIAIYIGGGQVMDNVGSIRTMALSEWVAYYSKSVPVRCGWL